VINPALEIDRLKLYVVLDLSYGDSKNIFDVAKVLTEKGVKTLQLRGKDKSTKELFLVGKTLRKITLENKTSLIINDRVDLCMGIDADGVHLGQSDLPIDEARKLIGEDKIIGISTHSMDEINYANCLDVDYISIGPIFKTVTKPNLTPVGLGILDKLPQDFKKPLVAIGGINSSNINKLYNKNLSGIAVVSAILASKNIRSSTKQLLGQVDKL